MEKPPITNKETFINHMFQTFSETNGQINLQTKIILACIESGELDSEFITPLLQPVLQLPDYLEFVNEGETVHEFLVLMLISPRFIQAATRLKELFTETEARYVCNAFINVPRKTHVQFKKAVKYIIDFKGIPESEVIYLILAKVLNEYAKARYGISSLNAF